jgi:predicted alpha/beta hydrolase family esterase
MTRFLDVRLNPVGGNLAASVAVNQGTALSNYQSLDLSQLVADIRGQHVLIATHGFHVNRADGIGCLSNWEGLLQLAPPAIFVGLLWPGDSIWAHGLDYPEEPKVANAAGQLIGPFLDAYFTGAASVSLASHSLGARVVLSTIAHMNMNVRRLMLMAGAIDDNCLNTEFEDAQTQVGIVSALASKKDDVLSALFPLGNLIGGIIAAGHPWWHAALGHTGPVNPRPANFQAPFQIPACWDYGHHHYLQVDAPPVPVIALPVDVPPEGSPEPAAGATGWQEAFSAALCSTRFR